MKIAISGLGRMGMQIAQKLAEGGHVVIAHNRSADKVDIAASHGAVAAYDKQAVVTQFTDNEQIVIWLMLPAEIIETELTDWLSLIPAGSLLIGGGNSDFRLTKRHAAQVADAGSSLVDIGTSGGIMGLKDGFCLMAGGDYSGFQTIEPVLHTLALPRGSYQHFGEGQPGAGHYIKMVHNAIEYGMMESLAEGYRKLHEGAYKDLDLAAAGHLWQAGSIISSGLNGLTAEALTEDPTLSGINGDVVESGEARWTLETAQQLDISMPAIQAAFDVRLASQRGDINFSTELLAAMRGKFGGHALNNGQLPPTDAGVNAGDAAALNQSAAQNHVADGS